MFLTRLIGLSLKKLEAVAASFFKDVYTSISFRFFRNGSFLRGGGSVHLLIISFLKAYLALSIGFSKGFVGV